MSLKQLDDWADGESVLVARGKATPEGERFDPEAAGRAIAAKLVELAEQCPGGYYLKRVKVRRERLDKGRGYFCECVFAAQPRRKE